MLIEQLTTGLLFDRSKAFFLLDNKGWAEALTPTLPVQQHRTDILLD
jgi:hypothetical protein